ncbi:hypothetical protein HK101_007303 [Irineochytrium annulatum]|nr:hypothetical protein HK101_007303 [Irineochytrium annulatum]
MGLDVTNLHSFMSITSGVSPVPEGAPSSTARVRHSVDVTPIFELPAIEDAGHKPDAISEGEETATTTTPTASSRANVASPPEVAASPVTAAMVGRSGSIIPLGASLQSAAEELNNRIMMDRVGMNGTADGINAKVGLAMVHVEEGSSEAPAAGDAVNPADATAAGKDAATAEAAKGTQQRGIVIDNEPYKVPESVRVRMESLGNVHPTGSSNYSTFHGAQVSTLLESASLGSLNIIEALMRQKARDFDVDKYVAERVRMLDSTRILITTKSGEVKRERRRLIDLKEKERTATRINALQREISEQVLEAQRISQEKQALEQHFESVKRDRDLTLSVFKELMSLSQKLKLIQEVRQEAQSKQSYMSSVNVSASHGSHAFLGSRSGSQRLTGAGASMSFMSLERSSAHTSSMSMADDVGNAKKRIVRDSEVKPLPHRTRNVAFEFRCTHTECEHGSLLMLIGSGEAGLRGEEVEVGGRRTVELEVIELGDRQSWRWKPSAGVRKVEMTRLCRYQPRKNRRSRKDLVADASDEIVKAFNNDHPDAALHLVQYWGAIPGAESAKVLSVDDTGVDLLYQQTNSEGVKNQDLRVLFDKPLAGTKEATEKLIKMATEARKILGVDIDKTYKAVGRRKPVEYHLPKTWIMLGFTLLWSAILYLNFYPDDDLPPQAYFIKHDVIGGTGATRNVLIAITVIHLVESVVSLILCVLAGMSFLKTIAWVVTVFCFGIPAMQNCLKVCVRRALVKYPEFFGIPTGVIKDEEEEERLAKEEEEKAAAGKKGK